MSFKRSARRLAVCLLILASFGASAARASDGVVALPAGDIVPPEIMHTPLEEFPDGMPLRIQARVTDDTGVKEVILFYRSAGQTEYRRMSMLKAPGGDLYAATLPANVGPRVEYFIQASDIAGNSVLGRLFDPYVITIVPRAPGEPELARSQTASPPAPVIARQPPAQPPPATIPSGARDASAEERRGISRWVWVGVGVIAVAALAGAGGGGGGGGGGSPDPGDPGSGSGTVTITAPVP